MVDRETERIVKLFEIMNMFKTGGGTYYEYKKHYNKITGEEEYSELRTRVAFYQFRDGYREGYAARMQEEI